MNLFLLFGLTILSAALVAWGLFAQASSVVLGRRNIKSIGFKLLGLIPFLWVLAKARDQLLLSVPTFFISLGLFLVLLTLARKRLLR
jgi:hypothetical protein